MISAKEAREFVESKNEPAIQKRVESILQELQNYMKDKKTCGFRYMFTTSVNELDHGIAVLAFEEVAQQLYELGYEVEVRQADLALGVRDAKLLIDWSDAD